MECQLNIGDTKCKDLIIFYYIEALLFLFVFFFQAEDGIRDRNVTGVQTCALPILDGGIVRTGLRSKARELLAFLLLHPAGVGREVAIEALWPEMHPARSAERAKDAL